MRRFVFALLFLGAAALFWNDLLGFALKGAVRLLTHAKIDYRAIRWEEGALILEDAVLFDSRSGHNAAYILWAPKIEIHLGKTVGIEIEQGCLTLSKDVLHLAPSITGQKGYPLQVTVREMQLEWSDHSIAPATFSFADDSLDISWKDGGQLSASKTEGGWDVSLCNLSTELFSSIVPISQTAGRWDGFVECKRKEKAIDIAMHVEGKNVSLYAGPLCYSGTCLLDAEVKELKGLSLAAIALSLDRLRLSLENAAIRSGTEEIHSFNGLASFQAGLGMKWEGRGVAGVDRIPLAVEGKAFLGEPLWVNASFHVGSMEGSAAWREGERWTFTWEHLNSEVAKVLLSFASAYDTRLKRIRWNDGSVSGGLFYGPGKGLAWKVFQAENLHVEFEGATFGCERIALQEASWRMERGRLKTASVQCEGSGQFDPMAKSAALRGVCEGTPVSFNLAFDEHFQEAKIEGSLGEIQFRGQGSAHQISIPEFVGKMPDFLTHRLFLKSCDIISRGAGLAASFDFTEGFRINPWNFACKIERGEAPYLTDITGELHANQEGIEGVAVEGVLRVPFMGRLFQTDVSAPRIQIAKDWSSFDIRLSEQEWDLVRVVCKIHGPSIEIDPDHSHLLSSPLSGSGNLSEWRYQCGEIPLGLLKALLVKKGFAFDWMEDFEGHLQCEGKIGEKLQFSFEGVDWTCRGEKTPFSACIQEEENGIWYLKHFALAEGTASLRAQKKGDAWKVFDGTVDWQRMLTCNFKGKFSDRFDGSIQNLKAEVGAILPSCRGSVEGQGCLVIHSGTVESDLDLWPKKLAWQDCDIENNGPVHLSLASSGRALLQGIDCHIHKGDSEVKVDAELLEIDWKKKHLEAVKAHLLMPSNLLETSFFDRDRELNLFGTVEGSFDGSRWSLSLQEGFLPLFGTVRHLKEGRIAWNPSSCEGVCEFELQGKPAEVAFSMKGTEPIQGTLILKDHESAEPLVIDWSTQNETLSIDSIEGEFGGVRPSFRAVDSTHLVGSAAIDFSRLSQWIPPETAEIFHDLEMGAGYVLQGELGIEQGDVAFKGLFCGKDIELFGYRLRSLLSQAAFTLHSLHIDGLKICDSGGSLTIPAMRIEQKEEAPWTIEIPEFTIRDLRPSLLRKPGRDKRDLTPLLVTELTARNFRGLLEEGKSYRASGELTFINSFKREKSVFDIPTDIFGRIIGLDLELLVPVEGRLFFELQDGYFVLTELRDAYSEGKRSQFFFAKSDTPPRMSLKGNLEILLTMKQYVLFALTEAFAISIDGKLSDPQFHLQKKKKG